MNSNIEKVELSEESKKYCLDNYDNYKKCGFDIEFCNACRCNIVNQDDLYKKIKLSNEIASMRINQTKTMSRFNSRLNKTKTKWN